jgi:amino acid transporter
MTTTFERLIGSLITLVFLLMFIWFMIFNLLIGTTIATFAIELLVIIITYTIFLYLSKDSKINFQRFEEKFNTKLFLTTLFIYFIVWTTIAGYFEYISIGNPNDNRCDIDSNSLGFVRYYVIIKDIYGKESTIHEYCDIHYFLYSIIHPMIGINTKENPELTGGAGIVGGIIGLVIWMSLISYAIYKSLSSLDRFRVAFIFCRIFGPKSWNK